MAETAEGAQAVETGEMIGRMAATPPPPTGVPSDPLPVMGDVTFEPAPTASAVGTVPLEPLPSGR